MSDAPSLRPVVVAMLERLRGMEQSRFWQLRNRFFDLKHRFGLSRDRAWPPYELTAVTRAIVEADNAYAQWTAAHAVRPADIERLRAAAGRLALRPVFSVIVTVASGEPELLRALASVRDQAYSSWQLIVATTPATEKDGDAAIACIFGEASHCAIERFRAAERCSGERLARLALEIASGEYVALLAATDAYASDAFYEFAALLNDDPSIDVAYGDEDVRGMEARSVAPFFKPDWAPESILARDYIGSGAVYRKSLIAELGGLDDSLGGAMVYDLLLRLSERTERIAHVPRILYHRARMAEYGEAGARAIRAALARRDETGTVEAVPSVYPTYRVRYRLRDRELASIVIPTRDHAEDLERCLASIFARSTYERFEVVIVDNDTKDPRALDVIASWAARDERVRVLRVPIPFNYSKLNNRAVATCSGTYVVLLNNDTEVISDDWLEALMEQAQRPKIGAVGALLRFPDRSVQHGGVILGIGGVAGHSHRFAEAESAGYFGALRATTNFAAVTAACLMVRRELYELVGGIDETLTVAFNDVDFCLRLRARGYRNVWLPHVELVHGESKSRGYDVGLVKERRGLREEAIMLERWGALVATDPYYNVNLTRRAEDYSLGFDDVMR